MKDKEPRAGLVELPQVSPPPVVRRFRVKLPDCKAFEFDARDAHEAEQLYRKKCGILATVHPFEIHELPALPVPAAEPVQAPNPEPETLTPVDAKS